MKSRILAFLLAASLILSGSVFAAEAEESKTEQLDSLFTTVDLMDATVAELLSAMERGSLSSQRLVQMYIDRIEAYDDQLNSIIAINPSAMEDARLADEKRASGEALGRLHGIPVIVKDNIDVAGMATTCGDVYRSYAIAAEDAEVVSRLKAEGAIILAKANMSEYAFSGCNSSSSMGGTVHNAYDSQRTPAGSSGGTAVAITCNFAAVGLGTDTGSSIRRPASFANIVGLRPSFGLVSQNGLYRLNWDQDTIGPMCRSVEDTALVLDIIVGSDEKDTYTTEADSYLPEQGYLSCLSYHGLEGKRIGYLANSFGYLCSIYNSEALKHPQPLHQRIEPMVEQAKTLLQEGGAELVDLSEILTETQISVLRYDSSQKAMLHFREVVTQLLAEHEIDAVLYISQTDVPELEAYCWDEETNNTASYINAFGPLAGLPEVMLPMGFSETDEDCENPLPLGMSLFASYGNDEVLFEIAYAYESIANVRRQPQITPALPDEALAAFAAELLKEVQAINSTDFTEESFDALNEAANQLKKLSMEEDVVGYQGAVEQLAAAYDSLRAPVKAEVIQTVTIASFPEEATGQEQTAINPRQILLGALTVGGILIVELADVILRKRVKKKVPTESR